MVWFRLLRELNGRNHVSKIDEIVKLLGT